MESCSWLTVVESVTDILITFSISLILISSQIIEIKPHSPRNSMSDDLDDFLDDLNQDFTEDTGPKAPTKRSSPPSARPSPLAKPNLEDDLDLESLLSDPDFITGQSASTKPAPLDVPRTKCSVLNLGAGSATRRVCANLRCSNCDCAVVCFEGVEWAGEIEYLFLRNNYPDYERMRGKLVARSEARAYACQCESVSVKGHASVKSLKSSLKWFCASH